VGEKPDLFRERGEKDEPVGLACAGRAGLRAGVGLSVHPDAEAKGKGLLWLLRSLPRMRGTEGIDTGKGSLSASAIFPLAPGKALCYNVSNKSEEVYFHEKAAE